MIAIFVGCFGLGFLLRPLVERQVTDRHLTIGAILAVLCLGLLILVAAI